MTAIVVTLVVTVWEWLENPGGIFRNEDGTRWDFVFDTAISWFLPTFGYVAVLAAVLHVCWFAVRRLRRPGSGDP